MTVSSRGDRHTNTTEEKTRQSWAGVGRRRMIGGQQTQCPEENNGGRKKLCIEIQPSSVHYLADEEPNTEEPYKKKQGEPSNKSINRSPPEPHTGKEKPGNTDHSGYNRVNIYVYIYIYVYVYIYMCICKYIYIYIYIYMYICVCMYIHTHIHVYICNPIPAPPQRAAIPASRSDAGVGGAYIYICIYVHICTYTCVCIHTHTHTHIYIGLRGEPLTRTLTHQPTLPWSSLLQCTPGPCHTRQLSGLKVLSATSQPLWLNSPCSCTWASFD